MRSAGTVSSASARLGGLLDRRRQALAAKTKSTETHMMKQEISTWASAVNIGSLCLWARQRRTHPRVVQRAKLDIGTAAGHAFTWPKARPRRQQAKMAAKAITSPLSQNVIQEPSSKTSSSMCNNGSTARASKNVHASTAT